MTDKITVLIVDDDLYTIQKLNKYLSEKGLIVLIPSHSYIEAKQYLLYTTPDIVLLKTDIANLDLDYIALAELIHLKYQIPFVLMSKKFMRRYPPFTFIEYDLPPFHQLNEKFLSQIHGAIEVIIPHYDQLKKVSNYIKLNLFKCTLSKEGNYKEEPHTVHDYHFIDIKVNDISYIETLNKRCKNTCLIRFHHNPTQGYLISGSMIEILALMKVPFLRRISHSIIVNEHFVQDDYYPTCIRMENKSLYYGRRFKKGKKE